MQKIRIKKTPRAGDQRDYSLVHRQAQYISEGVPTDTPVKNTMGAVPREEANIEVEGGETVVGDVNNDGFLEHMTFVGKRHSEGGVPVNIPEGSFIFSDTKKLKIKDKEALKTMFGLPYKKGGYTPAEIAKRYQVNNYLNDLKNPESDEITKRSATKMLQNNMEKLGMLALMQESMKGFPDGVPAIAESVMAGLQGQAASQEQPEMKNGGKVLPKAQNGLTNGRPNPGYTLYIGNQPVKVKSADISKTLQFPYNKDYIELENGSRLTQEEFNNIVSGKPLTRTTNQKGDLPDFSPNTYKTYSAKPILKSRVIQDVDGKLTTLNVTTGDKLNYKGQVYDVIDPFGEQTEDYQGSWKAIRDKFDNTRGIITVRDANGKISFLEGEDLGDLYKIAPDQVTVQRNQNTTVTPNSGPLNGAKRTYDATPQKVVEKTTAAPQPAPKPAPAATKPVVKAAPAKTSKPAKPSGLSDKDWEMFNQFEEGGMIGHYQDAGTVKEEPKPEAAKPASEPAKSDDEKEVQVGSYVDNGQTKFIVYKGETKLIKDSNGKILFSAPRTDKFVPHQGDKNPSVNPVTGKVEAGWNKSRLTPEKIDELARARGYTGPRDNKKLQEWIMQHPEYSKVVKELHTKYGQPKAGHEIDGFWGVRWDDALKAIPEQKKPEAPVATPTAPAEPKKEEVRKEPEVKAQPDVPAPAKKSGNWWLQDIVNFTGTLTDPINRYEPTQGKINLQTPGYATMDPTRRLAANQESFARLQNMTENTTDGNVGLAAMTGAQGQAFANAANAIGEVENANVGIVNNAYAQNANIMNQEAGANEAGRQKYVEDMATLNQQYDNALKQKKWREIAAFNNGTTNWFRKKQMENVIYPDMYIDPLNGDVEVDPSMRPILDPQTYSPAYITQKGESTQDPIEVYKDALQRYEGVFTPEEAKARAVKELDNFNAMKYKNMSKAQPSDNRGLILPGREFGGTIDYPWIDLD